MDSYSFLKVPVPRYSVVFPLLFPLLIFFKRGSNIINKTVENNKYNMNKNT